MPVPQSVVRQNQSALPNPWENHVEIICIITFVRINKDHVKRFIQRGYDGERIAEVKHVEVEELAKVTSENARRLYVIANYHALERVCKELDGLS